jgi:hypothetical protein
MSCESLNENAGLQNVIKLHGFKIGVVGTGAGIMRTIMVVGAEEVNGFGLKH